MAFYTDFLYKAKKKAMPSITSFTVQYTLFYLNYKYFYLGDLFVP